MKDYYLYTCVDAPRDGLYDAEWGGMQPVGFYVGGERREPAPQVALKQGINEIVLHYDSFGTARFALRDGAADIAPETLAGNPKCVPTAGNAGSPRSHAAATAP